MFFNPFEKLTIESFNKIVQQDYSSFIIQRLEWPGATKRWFIVSAYKSEIEASEHLAQLSLEEGKMFNLQKAKEVIVDLIRKDYFIFIGRMYNDWSKLIFKNYQNKIISFLRFKTSFERKDHIDIVFTLEYGRPIAKISNGKIEKIFPAIELLR